MNPPSAVGLYKCHVVRAGNVLNTLLRNDIVDIAKVTGLEPRSFVQALSRNRAHKPSVGTQTWFQVLGPSDQYGRVSPAMSS